MLVSMLMNLKNNEYRIDGAIRAKEVRVIGSDGSQLGIMSLGKARQKAEQLNLNLVEIAPNSRPVVCKLMDYGKFKFNKEKHSKENKKPGLVLKEMKFRPSIEENDIKTKLNHIQKFINSGYRVKITIMFRGREVTHPEIGKQLLDKLLTMLINYELKSAAKLDGKNMSMLIDPSKEYLKQLSNK